MASGVRRFVLLAVTAASRAAASGATSRTRTRRLRLRVPGTPDSERLAGLVEGPRGAIALVIGYVAALQRPGSVVPIHIQAPFGGGCGSRHRRNRHRGNYSDRGL